MRAVPPGAAGPDWAHAPSYVRRHLAAHAAAAGLLDDLLEDPLYLLTVDPARLVPHLDAARSAPARATAAVYRQSAHLLAPPRPANAGQPARTDRPPPRLPRPGRPDRGRRA